MERSGRRLALARPDQPLPANALDLDPALIRARMEWAVRAGHPGYLWPDVPLHVWRACLYEIERVTAKVLNDAPPVELSLPEDADPYALGIAAFTAGMGPLLGHWLESDQLRAGPEVTRILRLHLEHGRGRAQRFHGELLRFLELAASVGVPVAVIKSAHTAPAHYPDEGTRPAADIDVAVHPEHVHRLNEALQQAGYRPTTRQKQPYRCDWLPPHWSNELRSIELTHCDNPATIEVHGGFDRVFDGVRIVSLGKFDDLTQPWPELHPNALCLQQPARAALLALHTSEELHHLQLIRVVDLVFVLRQDFAGRLASWSDLIVLLESAAALKFIYPAVELVERIAPGTVPEPIRRRIAGSAHRRLVRVVSELRPATAQRIDRLTLEHRLMWADGWWQTLRRLAYIIWPWRARHSRRQIASVYRERLYRILRGRFGIR